MSQEVTKQFRTTFARRGFSNLSPPHPTVVGYCAWMLKLRAPLVGAQGYQRFPISKPTCTSRSEYYIALHAVPAYRASTYLASAFAAHSTSFPPKFFQSSTIECVLLLLSSNESIFTCGRNQYILYRRIPQLTEHKTSSIY